MQELASQESVVRAHWGVLVTDLGGQCLASLDAGGFFHPASTAKLMTTAAAMALGPEATVTTRLEGRGPLSSQERGRSASTAPASSASGAAKQVLAGDLVLVGVGDGSLATEDVPFRAPVPSAGQGLQEPGKFGAVAGGGALRALERLADAVVAANVVEIDGDVVGDDTRFAWEPYPEDWAQDDLLWGYGAPVSALSVHDNQVLVGVRPGTQTGEPAVVETEAGMPAWWAIEARDLRTAPAGSGTHVAFGRLPGRPRALRIWGTIAVGAPELTEELSIEEPALFAAEALRGMLADRGVQVTGVARAEHRLPLATTGFREQIRQTFDRQIAAGACCVGDGCVCAGVPPLTAPVLAEVRSPTVAEDAMATNKESLNLHAELLLERLGLQSAEPGEGTAPDGRVLLDAGSRAAGVRVVRSVLAQAGIHPDDVVLVDGSGLSTHDLVTPRAMVQLLLWASGQPWFAAWRSTLPVGGVDGTLASRFTQGPLRGRLHAKTGTLGESRALTGYLQCASGRVVAISVMVDGHAPGGTADRDAMDRMVEAIYRAE